MNGKGIFYIISTPIGNIEDITLRAIKTLKEVDIIVAEHTNITKKLLNKYDIKKSVISYFDGKRVLEEKIIEMLKQGKKIGLVSDAGTPGISDPGIQLINKALQEKINVVHIPGPCSLISGFLLSGFAGDKFVFEGFLERKKSDRRKRLKKLINEQRIIILFESPHRLKETLNDIFVILGNREITVLRELTKIYEERISGNIKALIEHYKKISPRGEFVIIIRGKEQQKEDGEEGISETTINKLNKSELAKLIAKKLQVNKDIIYKRLK